MLGCEPQLVGHREQLERGVGGRVVRRELLRGRLAGGERVPALAAQVEHRREPALRHGALDAVADVGELAPRAARLRQIAGQLGAARVALERLQATIFVGAVEPHVQRQPPRLGPVAEGVDRLGLDDRAQQRVARAVAVARADPVGGDLAARGAGGLDRLGARAVQGAPAPPRHVRVQRFAGERVAERCRPAVALAREPVVEQLGHALRTRQRPDEVQVERLARDGGRLGRRAARLRQLGSPDEDGVADGLGDGDLAVTVELEPLRARPQRTAYDQRRREFLDEERDALGRLVDRPHERRRGCGVAREREQRGDVAGLQPAQRELLEPARAPQRVA